MNEELTKLTRIRNYGGVMLIKLDSEDVKNYNLTEGDLVRFSIVKLDGPREEEENE